MASPKIASFPDDEPGRDRKKILWDSLPPPETDLSNYRLIRVQAGRPQGGVLLARRMIGTHTHYWRKRTTPCIGERCQACKDGNAPRWYGYFAVYNDVTRTVSILEIPAATVRHMLDRYGDWTDWRGVTLITERVPNKPNGRVHATMKDTRGKFDQLPDAPDVGAILAHIWEQHINENDRHEGTR